MSDLHVWCGLKASLDASVFDLNKSVQLTFGAHAHELQTAVVRFIN